MRLARLAGVLTSVTVIACEHPFAPVPDPRLERTSAFPLSGTERGSGGEDPSVTGAGQYNVNGLIVSFSIEADGQKAQEAHGEFSISADEGGGLTVSFAAKVTCLSIDPVNRHAWIGGTIKENNSTDPDLQGAIQQKGQDIWFRVLDDPTGDRSTFVGFAGSAGFRTSADYCAGQPWAAGNARTWPVVSGDITIRP